MEVQFVDSCYNHGNFHSGWMDIDSCIIYDVHNGFLYLTRKGHWMQQYKDTPKVVQVNESKVITDMLLTGINCIEIDDSEPTTPEQIKAINDFNTAVKEKEW